MSNFHVQEPIRRVTPVFQNNFVNNSHVAHVADNALNGESEKMLCLSRLFYFIFHAFHREKKPREQVQEKIAWSNTIYYKK
jgi:hypothetical protein